VVIRTSIHIQATILVEFVLIVHSSRYTPSFAAWNVMQPVIIVDSSVGVEYDVIFGAMPPSAAVY
jgi:hypothetical protein